jgi:ketosteroid isomerase-like protein
MKKVLTCIIFLSAIIILNSCKFKETGIRTDMKEELPLIENSIRNVIGWAKNKDFKLLYSIIANDSDYLEVGPDGRVTMGIDDFRKNETVWGDPGFKAVGFEIRDLKITLSQSGTVAWFYCVLDDINEWKGEPASWLNTSWTGVLEKRKDRWIIVQMHFSFPKE